jgi:farnesyl-diphosphate farnesyltransferase
MPDLSLQRSLLDRVSRTFALTIPALPSGLEEVVANAYLLCRIADTIEDAPTLDAAESVRFGERFLQVLAGDADVASFATDLLPRLGEGTTVDEQRLVAESASVLAITGTFTYEQRDAVRDCIRIMTRGMATFRRRQSLAGLNDLADYAAYCYAAAGVVGEMLTRLFVAHSPVVARRRDTLQAHAVAFGRGLQMTNILKDVWEDRARGVCWLPRTVFAEEGLEVAAITPGMNDARFARAWRRLVGLARADLESALAYTLALPSAEVGMRNFCLWSLFMAVMTLRRLAARPQFADAAEVKISRSTVALVVSYCRLAVRSDLALRTAFLLATAGLPEPSARDRAALTGRPHRPRAAREEAHAPPVSP